MAPLRAFAHENKAVLSVVMLVLSLIVMILAIHGMPDDKGNEGSGPLAPLKGWTFIMMGLSFMAMAIGGYIIYKYVSDKNRFEELMNSNSQAIFKRNQIEIERLALRLTSKEEGRVVEAMKKYRIR